MKALTIQQPWAWCIARGPKRIENRTWVPPMSSAFTVLAIHAGKRLDYSMEAFMRVHGDVSVDRYMDGQYGLALEARRIEPCQLGELPRGAIVACAWLVGHVTDGKGDPWWAGPYGWKLAGVVSFDPVPCIGAQGLWTVPHSVESIVAERTPLVALLQLCSQLATLRARPSWKASDDRSTVERIDALFDTMTEEQERRARELCQEFNDLHNGIMPPRGPVSA